MHTALILFMAISIPAFASEEEDVKTADAEPKWDIQATHGPTHTAEIETNEGTWMSVSVHGESVIFDLLGDLWTLPLTGGDARRLTEGAAWDSEPRFSPDGQRIAYVSDAGGNEQLWIMNSDGTEAKQFTNED